MTLTPQKLLEALHARGLPAALVLAILAVPALFAAQPAPTDDIVIANGRVIDPASGLDAIRNVGISGGRIAEISTSTLRGKSTVDARGLVVAPGFIDIHAHGQTAETYRFQSLDGVTSSFELELGTADVADWYRARAAGQRINYGVSIGHIKVRMAVLRDSGKVMPTGPGAYRVATPDEVREIDRRIQQGLNDGAV